MARRPLYTPPTKKTFRASVALMGLSVFPYLASAAAPASTWFFQAAYLIALAGGLVLVLGIKTTRF